MHKAVKIEMKRLEGKIPLSDPVVLTGEGIFARAFSILLTWAHTAPENNMGYDKCHIFVHFDDGKVYSARYDLYREGNKPLDQYINDSLLFTSGEKCPTKWTPQQYKVVLDRNPKFMEESKVWKDNYLFAD